GGRRGLGEGWEAATRQGRIEGCVRRPRLVVSLDLVRGGHTGREREVVPGEIDGGGDFTGSRSVDLDVETVLVERRHNLRILEEGLLFRADHPTHGVQALWSAPADPRIQRVAD